MKAPDPNNRKNRSASKDIDFSREEDNRDATMFIGNNNSEEKPDDFEEKITNDSEQSTVTNSDASDNQVTN